MDTYTNTNTNTKIPVTIPDSEMQKRKLIHHLKIIEGQIRGLQEMLKGNTYCINIVAQTSSIKQALSNIEDILLRNHLSTCLIKEIKNGNEKIAINEILKVFQLKRR